MAGTNDDRLMLCLAGLSYRGFWRTGWGDGHVEAIRTGIEDGLRDLQMGGWKIVWGPACFRPRLGWFDDQVVYVAKDPAPGRPRYVVSIRGTNPISLSDWIFGDLLASPRVAWPFDRAAHLTLSTALGLAIVLSLGAEPAVAMARTNRLLSGVKFAEAEEMAGGARLAARRVRLHDLGLGIATAAASALQRRGRASEWAEAIRTGAQLTMCIGARKDLIGFLRDAVAAQPDSVEVVVTGHSKGGALAAALAAWLLQTRAGDKEDAWDPNRTARVRGFTFAGPTPGDQAFAKGFLQNFADPAQDFRRTWNRRDIVPHSFSGDDLDKIRFIYDAQGIVPLLEILRQTVGPLGYFQVGDGLPFPDDPLPPSPKLSLLKAADEHMESYLQHLGIAHTTGWFFLGKEPGFLARQILRLAGHRVGS